MAFILSLLANLVISSQFAFEIVKFKTQFSELFFPREKSIP